MSISQTPALCMFLGGGNSNIFDFHPYLGKIPILTRIFFKWVGSTTNQVSCSFFFLEGWGVNRGNNSRFGGKKQPVDSVMLSAKNIGIQHNP